MAHGTSTSSLLARRILLAASLLLLLWLGGRVALSFLLDPGQVVQALSERTEAVLGAPLVVEEAKSVLLPPSLRLSGVSLGGTDAGSAGAAGADRVSLKVAVFPLLRGQLRLRGVEARRVLAEVPLTPTGDRLMGLELDRLTLKLGERGSYQGTADGRLTKGTGPGTPLRAGFELRTGDPGAPILHVGPGVLHLRELPLEWFGTLSGGGGEDPTLVAEIWGERLPLERVLELFPPLEMDGRPLAAQGSASVRIRWAGKLGSGSRPGLGGNIGVQAESLLLGDATLAEAVGMELTLLPGLSLEGSARCTFLGGPGEFGGRVALLGDGREMDITFRGSPSLEAATLLGLLPGGMGGEGRLGAAVRVKGPIGEPGGWMVDGNLFPREVLLTSPGWSGALEVPEGAIALEASRARIDALPVVLRGDSLTVDGEIPNLMAYLGSDSLPLFQGTIRRR